MEEVIATSKLSVIVKNLSYIPAFLIGIGLPTEPTYVLGAFMLMDVFVGTIRSIVLHGTTAFKSRTLTHGIISKMLVFATPVIIVFAGRGAGIDFLPVARGAITIFILSEAYSIFGHIVSIRTEKDVAEFDAVSLVLKNIRALLEKALTVQTQKDNTPNS